MGNFTTIITFNIQLSYVLILLVFSMDSSDESLIEQFAKPGYSSIWGYSNPPSFTGWKGLPKIWEVIRWLFTSKQPIPSKQELDRNLPVQKPDFKDNAEGLSATWLGHATVLVRMEGVNFITDPVFSAYAAPTPFLGPIRYRDPPCKIEDMPQIHFGVISHNHYDHLDSAAVKNLSNRFKDMRWYVPEGLKDWFRKVVPNNPVEEFNWFVVLKIERMNK